MEMKSFWELKQYGYSEPEIAAIKRGIRQQALDNEAGLCEVSSLEKEGEEKAA
jgi:hypothetical protein